MSDGNLTSILLTLESPTSGREDKIEAYTIFVNHVKGNDLSLFSLDVATNVSRIIKVVVKDIMDDNAEINQGALQVTGCCLYDSDFSRHLSKEEAASICSVLCQCVLKTENKTTCTRALWCLSKQKISESHISPHIHSLLCGLEHAIDKWKSQTVIVENEAVNVIKRLLEQVPAEMEVETLRWSKLVLPLLIHNAVKIREAVRELVISHLSTLLKHKEKLAQSLMGDFKTKIGPELKKLFVAKDEVHVLKCWEVFVQIFGKELHHGSFINHLLSVIESAFKSPSAEVKCSAFEAWQQLIDNFASNMVILTDPKRVKLIMQVFKVIVAKTEPVAMVKLRVWWHYVWLMGAKLSTYFDQVCLPLLQFCIGGSKIGNHGNITGTPRILQNGTSPATPRLNLSTPGTSNAQTPVFRNLQLKACEVLSHILGNIPTDLDVPKYNYTLDPLSHAVITGPSFFNKQANLLISCCIELLSSLGSDIPEGLLFHIWYSLIAHINNSLESGVKHEVREIITTFLTQFQILVLSRTLPTKTILKMFEAVCCLPKKALCSTAYNISNGEKIHGNPALFLTELLLTPVLLKNCTTHKRYLFLYNKLLDCGFGNSSGSLEFGKPVLQLLNRNVQFIDDPEMIWQFWNGLAVALHEDVSKTNEVNQGDALEPDFSCMYAVLIFPVAHKLAAKMPVPTVKQMQKTWSDIYRTFARLSALVTNAKPNICCEDYCHKVLDVIGGTELEDIAFLDFMTHSCLVMINNVDFSSMGPVTNFNLNALSPAKWTKRKQKPLENLNSFVQLTNKLIEATTNHPSLMDTPKKLGGNLSLQGPANNLVEISTVLFTHVSSSNMVANIVKHQAKPVSEFFHGAAKKTGSKIYNNVFNQKLEKLWLDICTSIQSKYTGLFESDFLGDVSPLLESTFLHPRRSIKNQTIVFWNSTFSRSPSLTYPENLKSVLLKVKQKTPITLPGWINPDMTVIEETPLSQMSQAESQAPEPHIPGMPSPGKLHGSFLHKAVSPNVKKSPAKPESKAVGMVKKKLMPAPADVTNDDFVVIKSMPKKRQVLTEHQKEVMKEKRVFPTMYNSLDISQDTSMMANFNTESQSVSPSPSTDSVILLGSSFGSQNKQNSVIVNDSEDQNDVKTGKEKSSKTGTKEKRSVRFSNNDEEKKIDMSNNKTDVCLSGKNSDNGLMETDKNGKGDKNEKVTKQATSDEGKQIEHFSVIKKNVSSDSLDEKEGNSSDKSSSLTSEGKTPPQNLLGVIGIMDSLESNKTSTTTENGSKENGMLSGDSDSQKWSESEDLSEPLLNWSKELKRLKSTKETEDKTQSDKEVSEKPTENAGDTLPKKSLRRRTPNSKYKDDFEVDKYSHDIQKGSLDSWVIKSPLKGVSAKTKKGSLKKTKSLPLSLESSVPSSAVTVVEETQSPTKMNRGSSGVLSKDSVLPAIQETPPRPTCGDSNDSVGSNKGSSRKLFTQESNLFENDSELIQGSPGKCSFQGKIGTPVLKLKRLTHEEILHYSPTRKEKREENETTPRKSPPGVDAPLTNDEGSHGFSHEHDDFSQIKPLDLMGSQGFDTAKTADVNEKLEIDNVSRDKNEEQGEDKNAKRLVDPDLMPPVLEAMESDDFQCAQNLGKDGTENLFTQSEAEVEYNPDINSTFKSSASTEDVLGNKNLDVYSEDSESERLSLPESEDSDLPATYNPSEISTLVDNSDTPKRGRKRKQQTPKRFEESELLKAKRRKRNRNDSGDRKHKQKNKPSEKSSIVPPSEEKSCDEKENVVINDSKEDILSSTDKENIIADEKDKIEGTKIQTERIGEKTPETKTIEAPPTRKSTTKKKKEVAHRRSLNKNKNDLDITHTDSDGSEDSQQPVAIGDKEEKSIEVIESVGRFSSDDDIPLNQMLQKSKTSEDNDALETREKVLSSEGSDDNVPLSQIMKTQNAPEDLDKNTDNDVFMSETDENKDLKNNSTTKENKSKPKGKTVTGKLSPLSNRLRSSGRVLRARGKPMRRLPDKHLTDKSVKIRRRKSEGDMKSDDSEVSCSEDVMLSLDSSTDVDNTSKTDEVDSCIDDSEKVTEKSEAKSVDETPKKVPEKTLHVHFPVNECYSDSKLITASRKFERKQLIARRSILKPSSYSTSVEKSLSPRRHKFHPIRIHHAVSPAASPSAGILKRKKLGNFMPSNSPSPPNKQRRVSFSTPLTFGKSAGIQEPVSPTSEMLRPEPPHPASPLVTSCSTRVTSAQEKFYTTPSSGNSSEDRSQPTNSCSYKDSELTPTQNSYRATQESQLNAVDPVYPDLTSCDAAIDKVLPQLTSSMWVRGLDKLVRARNIHTVGDLSSLSEREVHELPIRSPKVANVRSALKKFETQQEYKRSKLARTEVPEAPSTSKQNTDSENVDKNVTDILSSSSDLLDEVNKLTSQENSTSYSPPSCPSQQRNIWNALESMEQSGDSPTKNTPSVVDSINDLIKNCKSKDLEKELGKLKTNEIFHLHNNLTDLVSTVVSALKSRCHSPEPSQS